MKLSDMTKDERSLLLYFESCAVDKHGKVDGRKMNKEDFSIAEAWEVLGFATFCRLPGWYVLGAGAQFNFSHYVILSDEAWELAAQERRARADRNRSKLDDILNKEDSVLGEMK